MKFVIVCGYGCLITDRVRDYLEDVVGCLRANPTAVVIVTGGFSNQRSMPCISEAWVMDNYMKSRDIANPVIQDDRAVTTLEEIQNAAHIIVSKNWRNDDDPVANVVIFCDRIDRFKIQYLARRIFCGEVPTPMYFEVRGHNFKRSIRERLHQYLIATPLEILSHDFDRLARMLRARRLSLNAAR